jgi:hypothetical protein
MSETKYLKCACASCGGHIEFPADAIGSTVPCPHCGWQTELTIEAPPVQSSSRSLKWIIAGGVILLVGVVGVVAALIVTARVIKKTRAARSVARSTVVAPSTNRVQAKPAVETSINHINDFSFANVAVEKIPNSTLVYARGSLKNETDKQRFAVTVEIELLDKSGVKIGTAKDYTDLIEPHAEWKFRASVLQKNVASARVANVKEQQ